MLENFEKTFEAMVAQSFNINLYGPSGCGKTYLLNKVFNDQNKYTCFYIKFNLSDFYSKKNIFRLISKNINKYLSSKSKTKQNISPIENLNKWYDLYQCLDDFKASRLKIYFIIDSILDMDSFNYYKKEIIKLFVALKSYQNMKIILISNFDITNSEIQSDYDFSSIIPIQFPVLSNEELKSIIEKVCNGKYYDKNRFDDLVNTCIKNFEYNFSNLNEIILNIEQNLHSFNYMTVDGKMYEFNEKAKYIPSKNKKDKDKKDKEKEKDEDIEMRDEREEKENDSEEEDRKEKENKYNKANSKHQSQHQKYEKDIYSNNHHAISNGLEFNQDNLRLKIKMQTRCAPIHEMKLESFFKNKDTKQFQDFQEELRKEKDKDKDVDDKKNNQTKNLTESLSKSQKMLLLASYLASEISTKHDQMIFKPKKNKGPKRLNRKNNNNAGYNLKSTTGYKFNVHRLIAIYQSLLSSNNLFFPEDDIMVKCEIATLEKLGLIKNLSSFDSRTMDQKYITKINFDLVRKIAEDFDIRLEDYIKVDSLD